MPGPAARLPAPLPSSLPSPLPPGARWRQHLSHDLLRFWTHADALGTPHGNFPTFRCNDGSAYRNDAPCPELGESPPWITNELGTEYVRMKSRQAFVYGVGYHVTGDARLLAHARAGVDYLRKHAYDAATGSAISYWRQGAAGPGVGQRTTQDLAYAQLGLAFYYYLTRDPDVLADLVRLKDHVFSRYFEPSWGMLRWVASDHEDHLATQMELVAQLDQINAYLLLVTPLLGEPLATEWRRDLVRLTRVMIERFFAADQGLFWGAIHSAERMKLGTHHTDFGHTIKALWMIRLVGELAGDAELIRFAETHMALLVERAHNPDTGCWASTLRKDGSVDRSSNWWTSAELDQAVATLAIEHPSYRRYLARSYDCWLERFVDKEHGEVWMFLPEDGVQRGKPLKVFHWKNGYHSAEHALVALITTAAMEKQPVELYYAFDKLPPRDRIRPYFFRGTIAASEPVKLESMPGAKGQRITFESIGL